MRPSETCVREPDAPSLLGDGPVRVSDIVGDVPVRPAAGPRRRTYRRAVTGWYDAGFIVLFAASVAAVLACLWQG